jgi:chorismate mutase-like protein
MRLQNGPSAPAKTAGHGVAAGEKPLAEWRQEIDALDIELLRLLNRRAAIACEIAQVKVACGIAAYDPAREAQVLKQITAQNAGPFEDESVRAIFHSIIHETRTLGTRRMLEAQATKSK